MRLCFGWHPETVCSASAADTALGLCVRPIANRGYLVVGESTARMFDCDEGGSAVLDLRRAAQSPEAAAAMAERLNRDFDALVLGMAYEIGPGWDHSAILALLERISIPIITLGLAIEKADLAPESLHPSVRGLLDFLNAKAALFGVRAHGTQAWLARHGYGKAVPVGCPSLHLDPAAILDLAPLSLPAERARFASGGYLFRESERSRALARLFDGFDASYVMQDELSALDEGELGAIAWSGEERELNADDINRVGETRIGARLPFRRYFFFDDLPSWRRALARHDAYAGDRFHGAVVALQIGKPTVVICKDIRSQELCAFYDLPSIPLETAAKRGLASTFETALAPAALDRMKQTYSSRAHGLSEALATCGLRLRRPI